MNVELLKGRFAELPQGLIDTAVSNINAYRDFIGNGVAVGKLAEPIIAQLLNDPSRNMHSFPFVFTGKNPPFDIIVYKAPKEIPRSKFTEVRSLYAQNYSRFHTETTSIVGSGNWCGISIKNYINEAAQISTNYSIREYCESVLGDEEKIYEDQAIVQKIYGHLKSELGHETILFLNSFPDTKTYQFALFDTEGIKITSIEYHRLTKHARYTFRIGKNPIFHLKYGMNQANPYQRGAWVDDLSCLPLLRKGSYVRSDFGSHILRGALEIHPFSNSS